MRKVVRCKCCGKIVVVCYSKDEVFNSREYSIKCSSCKSYDVELKNNRYNTSQKEYDFSIPTQDYKYSAPLLPYPLLLNPIATSLAMTIPLYILIAYIRNKK